MNNRMGALIKKSFKERYLAFIPGRIVPGMTKNYIGRLLTYILSYVMLSYFYFLAATGFGEIYLNIANTPSLYFAMFGVLVGMSVVLFQTHQIMTEFFSTRDNYIMLTLPIKSEEILMGNFLGDILSDFDHLIFLAILLFIYNKHATLTLPIVLLSILNFPMLVVIPKAIIAILILLLIKGTRFSKFDKFFTVFRYLVSFVLLGVFYYFMFSKNGTMNIEELTQNQMVVKSAENLTNFFFQSRLYGNSVVGTLPQNLISTLILWAIGIALMVGLKALGKAFYRDTLMVKDASSDAKPKSKKSKVASFKSSSKVQTIAKHEFQNITSDIAFLSPMIVTTIMFFAISFGASKELLSENPDFFSNLDSHMMFIYFIIGLGSGLFIWIYSQSTKGALSREGTKFYLFQTLPISPKDHLNGRILGTLYLTLLYNGVLSLVFMFMYKAPPVGALIVFLGSLLGSLVANMVSLYQGTFNINIHWTKPSEIAQSRGARAFVDMIIAMVVMAVIVGGSYLVYDNTNEIVTTVVVIIFHLIIFAIFYNLALKRYKKGFKDI